MGPAAKPAAESRASASARWVQLVLGIVGMVAIANLQYGWTLFVNPIDSRFHWGKAAIQVAFTVFVLAETWLVPFEGDRKSTRLNSSHLVISDAVFCFQKQILQTLRG